MTVAPKVLCQRTARSDEHPMFSPAAVFSERALLLHFALLHPAHRKQW